MKGLFSLMRFVILGVLIAFALSKADCLLARETTFGHGVSVPASDSVILFRFPKNRLMHFRHTNERSLAEATALIERHRSEIHAGTLKVAIDGYLEGYESWALKRKAVRNRSNQVKSHFLMNLGLKESDFYTTNYIDRRYRGEIRDVVVLTLVYADSAAASFTPTPTFGDSWGEPAPTWVVSGMPEIPTQVYQVTTAPRDRIKRWQWPPIAIKSNLLYDAILAPSLSVEALFNDRWSAQVDATVPWWHSDHKHQYYQMALITGEARYWFRTTERWHGHYAGLMAGGAWYDLEPHNRGFKGEAWLGGFVYGYMWPISEHWSLDAEIGLGYMTTKSREYLPMDGHYVFQKSRRIHYFGPIKLGLSLSWRLDYEFFKRVKGGESDE